MKNIMSALRPHWKQLSLGAILGGASLIAAVGLLAASAWLISMASTRPPILVLEVAIVAVRFFGLSRGFLRYAGRISEHDAALKIQTDLRISIYQKLSKFLPQTFVGMRRGNLLSQIINDVEQVQDLWLRMVLPWLAALISGAAGIGIMYWLAPTAANAIALIFLLTALLVPLISTLSSGSNLARDNEAALFDQVMQVAESANEALIFNFREELMEDLILHQDTIEFYEAKKAKRAGYASAFYMLGLASAVLTGLYFAAQGFSHHNLAGVNVAVIALLPLVIFDGLSTLPSAFSQMRQVIEAASKLNPYLESGIEEKEVNPQLPLSNKVSIEFVEVSPILDGTSLKPISASIIPGQTLLVMGKSSSGKSSLINALLGFLPYTGKITINGEPLAAKHEPLFSTLLQDDYLFATSIRENLKIGKPSASDREIDQILEVVELGDLVHHLPEGLDTHVGPLGYNFSGGEKQRMKLARLLLRNTPVFILDEPYEYLDSFQVDRIAKKVEKILHGKTVIIISHLDLPITAKTLLFAGAPRQD